MVLPYKDWIRCTGIKIASYIYSILLYKIKVSVVLHSPYTTCSHTASNIHHMLSYVVHPVCNAWLYIQSSMPVAMCKCTCMPSIRT